METIESYRDYPLIYPIDTVRALADAIEVQWSDGRTSRFHFLWLRDNCRCAQCVHAVTREQVFEIVDVAESLRVRCANRGGAGELSILWDDDHHSTYTPGWLRVHAYDDISLKAQRAEQPLKSIWQCDISVPVWAFDDVMGDDTKLLAWLLALRDIGLTQIRGVPPQAGALIPLVQRISFIRKTDFGTLFDVCDAANANSTAYTALRLPLHMDLPTRELPPGLQFLHCLVNDAAGGESIFVDGFAIARALRGEDPAAFDLLCSIPITFHNQDRSSDHRHTATMIGRDAHGEVIEIRTANFLRAPFSMPEHVMKAYYGAYRRWLEMTRESRFQYVQKLYAGEMWAFDNRRILHARNAFEPSSGTRHFEGCYMDRDGLLSRIHLLQREQRHEA